MVKRTGHTAPRATSAPIRVPAHDAALDDQRFVDAALDVAGSLIYVFDAEGRFLRFNRACERVSGYDFDEIRGRPFYDFLIPKPEVEAVRAAIARIRPGQPPDSNENQWVTREGALRRSRPP